MISAGSIHYSEDLFIDCCAIVLDCSSQNGNVGSLFMWCFYRYNWLWYISQRVLELCVDYLRSFIIQHDVPSRSACTAGITQAAIRLSPIGRCSEIVARTEWREGCRGGNLWYIIEVYYCLKQDIVFLYKISYSQFYHYLVGVISVPVHLSQYVCNLYPCAILPLELINY